MPFLVKVFPPTIYHVLPFYQQNWSLPWPSYCLMWQALTWIDWVKDFFLTKLINAYAAGTKD